VRVASSENAFRAAVADKLDVIGFQFIEEFSQDSGRQVAPLVLKPDNCGSFDICRSCEFSNPHSQDGSGHPKLSGRQLGSPSVGLASNVLPE